MHLSRLLNGLCSAPLLEASWMPLWRRTTESASHVCVSGGIGGGVGRGRGLSGPPHMKGKLEPLIAVLTQASWKGRPLRKRKAGEPGTLAGGINGPRHNRPHYRNKHTPRKRTHTNFGGPGLPFGVDFTDGGTRVCVCVRARISQKEKKWKQTLKVFPEPFCCIFLFTLYISLEFIYMNVAFGRMCA